MKQTGSHLVLVVVAALGFVACGHKEAATEQTTSLSSAADETPAQAADEQQQIDTGSGDGQTAVPPAAVPQNLTEVEQQVKAGSFDTAAAALLRMQTEGRQFSAANAAAYRRLLADAYSAALEAEEKGDPRGRAAIQMIRAASRR